MASSLKVGGRLQAAIARINAVKNTSMKVGVLGGATNPETGEKIAPYAAANEFGSPSRGIPPRPFFRNTIAEKSDEWGRKFDYLLSRQPVSTDSVRSALTGLGGVMVSDIQETIEKGDFAPLAPSTIAAKAAKGRAEPEKPLTDTGSMLRDIDFEIIEGGKS